MNNTVEGISLGRDCLPAAWGKHTAFRGTKSTGYLTCPFDKMVSNYEGVVKCIQEDFAYFTDPAFLTMKPNKEKDKPMILYNTYYKFMFNHESPYVGNFYIKESWPEGPNHYIKKNYAHFIERYTRRINNFRQYMNNPRISIAFILFLKDTPNDCNELRDALSCKYPSLKYKIILIDGPVPHDIAETHIVKIIQ